MKKTVILIFTLAMALSMLTACGNNGSGSSGGNEAASNATNSVNTNDTPNSTDTNSNEPQQGRITNVTSPKFELSDGFIVPVKKQTTVPDGWIGISTAEEFDKIRLNPTGKYILMNDIDLSSINDLKSTNLGTSDGSGIVDGNGYRITGFKANLFGVVHYNSQIKNLSVVCDGYGMITVCWEGVSIDNCNTTGSITTTNNAYGYVGGIVEMLTGKTNISNCYNSADITINNTDPYLKISIGGIVGCTSFESKITNCFNTGTLVGLGNCMQVAGITTIAHNETEQIVSGCYNKGEIKGHLAGGICVVVGKAKVENCLNYGDVIGVENELYSSHLGSSISAGICAKGYSYGNGRYYSDSGSDLTVNDCYNTGTVSGVVSCSLVSPPEAKVNTSYSVGDISALEASAIFGSPSNIKNCYFLENVSSSTISGALAAESNIKKLTAEQMKDKASFAGFDFDAVWEMGSGDYSYPVFKAIYE